MHHDQRCISDSDYFVQTLSGHSDDKRMKTCFEILEEIGDTNITRRCIRIFRRPERFILIRIASDQQLIKPGFQKKVMVPPNYSNAIR